MFATRPPNVPLGAQPHAFATKDLVLLILYTPHFTVIHAIITDWNHRVRISNVSPAKRALDSDAKLVLQHEVRLPGVDLQQQDRWRSAFQGRKFVRGDAAAPVFATIVWTDGQRAHDVARAAHLKRAANSDEEEECACRGLASLNVRVSCGGAA